MKRSNTVFEIKEIGWAATSLRCLPLLGLLAFTPGMMVSAAAPPASPAQPGLYRMNQLEEAKKRALAEDKPITWLASTPEYLQPYSKLLGNGSHAATAYAIRALQKETVIVFSDAQTENHHEPKIVDEALHSPDPHYTVPGVIILTPSLDKVICKAPFTSDGQERIRIYTDVLKKIRDKNSWHSQ